MGGIKDYECIGLMKLLHNRRCIHCNSLECSPTMQIVFTTPPPVWEEERLAYGIEPAIPATDIASQRQGRSFSRKSFGVCDDRRSSTGVSGGGGERSVSDANKRRRISVSVVRFQISDSEILMGCMSSKETYYCRKVVYKKTLFRKISFSKRFPESGHHPNGLNFRLDKTKFHIIGDILFTAQSALLHPTTVVKTRMQVGGSGGLSQMRGMSVFTHILRSGDIPRIFRGFGTSAIGSMFGRALALTSLEISKDIMLKYTEGSDILEALRIGLANGVAGMFSNLASCVYFVPLDVVRKRVRQSNGRLSLNMEQKKKNQRTMPSSYRIEKAMWDLTRRQQESNQ